MNFSNREILESFSQNAEGNCAMIALIKASIIQYGLNKVVKREKAGRYHVVQLKNKELVIISSDELKAVEKKWSLTINEEFSNSRRSLLSSECQFLFAVMAKYLVMYGYGIYKYTFKEAVNELLNQFNTDDIPELLGINAGTIKTINRQSLNRIRKTKSCIIYNNYHACACSYGKFDYYGEICMISKTIPVVNEARMYYWYDLK